MATKPRAKKSAPPPPAPPRWLRVSAAVACPARHRMSGNLFPWWWVRTWSVIGKTTVHSNWTVTDLNVSAPLELLVRVPGWAKGVHVGFGASAEPNRAEYVVSELGTRDPRPGITDIDSPFYNLTALLL